VGDFAITITIDKPPETVFAFLADPAKLPLWLEAVDHVAFADTPPRHGARFQMARSLLGGRVVNEVELVKFDPGRRVALESPHRAYAVSLRVRAQPHRARHPRTTRRPDQR
jgi:uncharacterized protein YndB with AHSA1/START domain